MKLNLDLENLEVLVKRTLEENMMSAIENEINVSAKSYIEENLKGKIEELVNERIKGIVDEWFENKEITIGGGFGNREDVETYKVIDYVEKCITERMDNRFFEETKKDNWGNKHKEKVSFKEYVDGKMQIDTTIKNKFDKEMTYLKNDINNKITDVFNQSTKDMLSETVFNVLMKNDTFAKIEENVSKIADKK